MGGGDMGEEEEEEEAEEAGAQLAEYGLVWQVISLLLEAGARPAAPPGVLGLRVLAKRSWPSTASPGRSSACCWRPVRALAGPCLFQQPCHFRHMTISDVCRAQASAACPSTRSCAGWAWVRRKWARTPSRAS